jgi:hypothetical protein
MIRTRSRRERRLLVVSSCFETVTGGECGAESASEPPNDYIRGEEAGVEEQGRERGEKQRAERVLLKKGFSVSGVFACGGRPSASLPAPPMNTASLSPWRLAASACFHPETDRHGTSLTHRAGAQMLRFHARHKENSMNGATVTTRNAEAPQVKARLAGFFWLMVIVAGALALLGGQHLHFACNLAADVCYIVATVFVYDLLRPVNRSISLIAACISVLGCLLGLGSLFRIATVVAIGGAKISFICFGLHCFMVGYLILRSSFLPRAVGALMMFGGLGWLTLGFASLLSPSFARSLTPYILIPGVLGESSLTLWLLVRGVNLERWYGQAGAAAKG